MGTHQIDDCHIQPKTIGIKELLNAQYFLRFCYTLRHCNECVVKKLTNHLQSCRFQMLPYQQVIQSPSAMKLPYLVKVFLVPSSFSFLYFMSLRRDLHVSLFRWGATRLFVICITTSNYKTKCFHETAFNAHSIIGTQVASNHTSFWKIHAP